jgi:hypothetical protein
MGTFKSVSLSQRQHYMLVQAKVVFEKDFDKNISLGEFIAVLIQGYLEGRSIIEKNSEMVLTVVNDET